MTHIHSSLLLCFNALRTTRPYFVLVCHLCVCRLVRHAKTSWWANAAVHAEGCSASQLSRKCRMKLRFNLRPFCNASTEVLSQMMTDDGIQATEPSIKQPFSKRTGKKCLNWAPFYGTFEKNSWQD